MVHFIASLGVACLQIMTLPYHDCFVLFIPDIQSQKGMCCYKSSNKSSADYIMFQKVSL